MIDMRTRQLETRQVREGNAMLLQNRINIINANGSIEYGEWATTVTITNYGQCFDDKPKRGFFSRLLGI